MGDIDRIAKTTAKLGVSDTSELIALQFAAEKGGVASEAMSTALQRMTRRLADAARAGGPLADRLKGLGLNVKAMAEQAPDKSIRDIADAMAGLDSQSEKVSLAFQIFDTEGVGLVNVLQGGSAALDDASKRVKELGLSFSSVDAAQVETANDAIFELKSIFTGLWRTLVIKLAPYITAVTNKLTNLGATGGAAGEYIQTAIKYVVKAIAYMADVVDLAKMTWMALKIAFLSFQGVVLKGLAYIAQGIEFLINLIPGVQVTMSRTMHKWADDALSAASETSAALKDAFLGPSASEQVGRFFDAVEAESAAAGMRWSSTPKRRGRLGVKRTIQGVSRGSGGGRETNRLIAT